MNTDKSNNYKIFRKIFSVALKVFLIGFLLYTFNQILMIKILNISSMESSHQLHSENMTISKEKGYFMGKYHFIEKQSLQHINRESIPTEIFIEKERVYFENYYFYFGKAVTTEKFSINASEFFRLKKDSEYYYCFPDDYGECKHGLTPIEHYKYMTKIFDTIPSNVTIHIYGKQNTWKTKPDTLTYRKI